MDPKRLLNLVMVIVMSSVVLLMHGQETSTVPGRIDFEPTSFPKHHLRIDPTKTIDHDVKKSTNSSESYFTYSYTFRDLLVFSYEDESEISVYNAMNEMIWTGVLGKNQYQSLTPGPGVYGIKSSKPFSLLIGDPISNKVLGYFAMDEQGRGVSREFLTFMPATAFGQERLVMFGYEDNTVVKITDLGSGAILWNGILSKEEHFSSSHISNQFLHIEASHPVSVLSYADQGYLIPDKSGEWTGVEFLGYAGFVGEWPNDLNILSFEENASVRVIDLLTGEEIWSGIIHEGENYNMTLTHKNAPEVFFKVISNKRVSASISPFVNFPSSYAYLSDCSDYTGKRIGNLFYVPAIAGGKLAFNSFEDNNTISITNLSNEADVHVSKVNSGEFVTLNTKNVLYKIESTGMITGNVSCVGSAGGSFVPVYYGLDLPDLVVESSSITIDPQEAVVGSVIEIGADLINRGSMDIYDVKVGFYDGNPLRGGLLIGQMKTIDVLPAGGHGERISINWMVPEGPDYRQIYVFVDPEELIKESNESNNIASIPLVPNDDLRPPLSILVDAPEKLDMNDEGEYIPSSFFIEAIIINDSQADAINVSGGIILPDGLELNNGSSLSNNVGDIPANTSTSVKWEVWPSGNSSGDLYYSIQIQSDNTEQKTVNRKIYLPEPGPQRSVSVEWNGNIMLDAQIFADRGDGFKLVGNTSSDQTALLVNNLPRGAKLRAVKKVHEQSAVKGQHEAVDNIMFELWLDSDEMNNNGSYMPQEILDNRKEIKLVLTHPIYKYNLTLSTIRESWALDNDYYQKLEEGLRHASKLLYNATDGQVMLNKVAIYDEGDHYVGADIALHHDEDGNFCDQVNAIEHKHIIIPSFPSKLHMHRTQSYRSHEPDDNDWYHSFVHEFGHYGFGLYDEYLNGMGVSWKKSRIYNWDAGGAEHPLNYGLMQSHPRVTEFSSSNDYLDSYPIIYVRYKVTEQLDERKMSCFDYIQKKLAKYTPETRIKLPPYGYYPNGYIYDRPGPDEDYAFESVQILDMRGASKSTAQGIDRSMIGVTFNDSPVSRAMVYYLINNQREYLGRTDQKGELLWLGPSQGGTLMVIASIQGRSIIKDIALNNILPNIQVVMKVEGDDGAMTKNAMVSDVPGICISGEVTYDNDIVITSKIITDLALESTPEITLYYDEVIEYPSVFHADGTMKQFSSLTTISAEHLAEGKFNGSGYFDVSYKVNGQTYYATSYFKIMTVSDKQSSMHYNRSFDLHLDKDNFTKPELGINFTTFGTPCGILNQNLYPISEVFSFELEETESLNKGGGLNLAIKMENTEGFDLSSLSIYYQEFSGGIWYEVGNSGVNIEGLTGSCEVIAPGLFCLMATAMAEDTIAPDRIEDLVATTGSSQSLIELKWTVPDDSSGTGSPLYYKIRYNDVPVTSLNWDESVDVHGEYPPGNQGKTDQFELRMPSANQLYYFAVKSVDEAGNESELSNYASAISAVQKYTFSLVSPGFNDTLSNHLPQFLWERFDATGVSYTLMYDYDELFSNPVIISDIDTNWVQLDHQLDENKVHFWKVIAEDDSGELISSNQNYSRFVVRPAVGNGRIPFTSGQNSGYFYPNPFNPVSGDGNLRFTLFDSGTVKVSIYSLDGKCVRILKSHYPTSGNERIVKWNGRTMDNQLVPSGFYIYTLEQKNKQIFSGKILVY